MWLLTARDLQHHALRFGLAILGIALLLATSILIGGVASGFSSSATRTVEAINPGAWVLPAGASGAFTSYATFDAAVGAGVVADADVLPLMIMRGVASAAAPVGVPPLPGAMQDIVLVGHVSDALGSPPVDEGRAAATSDEVVASSAAELPIGSRVGVGGLDLEVVGTTDRLTVFAGTPLLFVDIEVARVLIVERRPSATALVTSGTVIALPEGFVSIAADAVAADALRLTEDAVETIELVDVLLWVAAASVIGAVVYLSALSRLRDFAVLEALGASARWLLAGLAVQATLVAVVAAVLAIGIAQLLAPVSPLPVDIDPATFLRLPVLATVVGLVAGLGGLRRVVAVDPAAAFFDPAASSGPGG